MTVEELIKELKRYSTHYRVSIQYPNDDQSWEPYIVLYTGNVVQAEIHIT